MCSGVRGSSGGNNRSNGSVSSSGNSGMSMFIHQFITGRPLPALPTAPSLTSTTTPVTSSPSPTTTTSPPLVTDSTNNNTMYTAKDRLVRLIDECHMKVKRDEIRVRHRIQRFGDITVI